MVNEKSEELMEQDSLEEISRDAKIMWSEESRVLVCMGKKWEDQIRKTGGITK